MEDDEDLAAFGEMEAIAHYADVLEQIELHESANGCDHSSVMIWEDMVPYWSMKDQEWVLLMRQLIEARREAESELSAKRLPWWRRWL